MRSIPFSLFAVWLLLCWHLPCPGIEIDGGKMEDVVVAPSGYSEGEVATTFSDGYYPDGPNNFEVYKDGNIYILDWLAEEVEKYDSQGKWLRTFRVARGVGLGRYSKPEPIYDIAVDNNGNMYLIGWLLPGAPKSLFKFSPEGELLWRLPSEEALETGDLGHGIQHAVSTDESGRVYNYEYEPFLQLIVYGSEGDFKGSVSRGSWALSRYRYPDKSMVQREVGDDIYFRYNEYLLRTSLEEYTGARRVDTVAVLPQWSRLVTWERLLECNSDQLVIEGWVERQFILIGFDRNGYFYFHHPEYWYNQRSRPNCQIHRILRFRVAERRLEEAGEVVIYFRRGKQECSDRELFPPRKEFIVRGDGTIYFLHGTVDTVKVSKITFQPGSE